MGTGSQKVVLKVQGVPRASRCEIRLPCSPRFPLPSWLGGLRAGLFSHLPFDFGSCAILDCRPVRRPGGESRGNRGVLVELSLSFMVCGVTAPAPGSAT